MSNILLTGGTGYIGSHTGAALAEAGHSIVLYDNCVNSDSGVIDYFDDVGRGGAVFVEGDVRSRSALAATLKTHDIDAVFHFAGLKAVGESNAEPLVYYDNNVGGTLALLGAMQDVGVKNLVFSSSATVYGEPQYLPVNENHPASATNPYGRTKLHIEQLLSDVAMSDTHAGDSGWRIACLRYFNPVGAHESHMLREKGNMPPNNLMPIIVEVAAGNKVAVDVFGNDYPTVDGTGVRDYIHVLDLAEGHCAALTFLEHNTGWHAFNLGTGSGCSVLELIDTFQTVCGLSVPYRICPRRVGDVAICYADVEKARVALNWTAKRGIEDMCLSAWGSR